jgi:hypothetical protein
VDNPLLAIYLCSLAMETIERVLETGQAQTITPEMVADRAGKAEAAHRKMQETP